MEEKLKHEAKLIGCSVASFVRMKLFQINSGKQQEAI